MNRRALLSLLTTAAASSILACENYDDVDWIQDELSAGRTVTGVLNIRRPMHIKSGRLQGCEFVIHPGGSVTLGGTRT
jgi:hypothetical protein